MLPTQTLKEKIIQSLHNRGPSSKADLAQRLRYAPNSLSSTLSELKKEGRIWQSRGIYTLLSPHLFRVQDPSDFLRNPICHVMWESRKAFSSGMREKLLPVLFCFVMVDQPEILNDLNWDPSTNERLTEQEAKELQALADYLNALFADSEDTDES